MSREIKTGFVAIAVIALFIWGYNFLKGENILEPNQRRFYVEYSNIQGLKKASPVTINGLQVGRVVGIQFNPNPEKKGKLIVEMLIDDGFEFSINSIAKIYSASLMGGQSMAIIPKYDKRTAIDGDFLKGEVESDVFSTVGEKLNPLQAKVESVIVRADSLLLGINQTLSIDTRKSLNRSVHGLEDIVADVKKTIEGIDRLITTNEQSLKKTLENTQVLTENFAKLSDTLANTKINETILGVQQTLANIDKLVAGLEQGNGTLGKLLKDEQMYVNLTNASKELEELLREMKLHPKRFVHFSLFGKKEKPYSTEENIENK